MSDWVDADRRAGFSAVRPEEVADLEALGAAVRSAREAAKLSRRDLALWAHLHPRSVERIEVGARRSRRKTLRRIAYGLAPGSEADRLFHRFIQLGGRTVRA